MPVHCELRDGKHRVCEPDGTIATTENGKARDGGGHETKAKCESQARVINSSLTDDTKPMNLTTVPVASIVRQVNLTAATVNAPVEIIYAGTFHLADRNMRLEVSDQMIDEMVANFQSLDGPDRVMVNVNHRSDAPSLDAAKAVGWLQDVYARRKVVDQVERYSLMGVPRWTDEASEAIAADQFKYLSAEIDFHSTDTLSGADVGCRLVGVALTNIPAIPKLEPVCLAREDSALKIELTIQRLAERSMYEHMEIVARAFFRQFPDSNIEWYGIDAVFGDYLIISTETVSKVDLFRVDYIIENNEVLFAEREQWKQVEHVYRPLENEDKVPDLMGFTSESNGVSANTVVETTIVANAAEVAECSELATESGSPMEKIMEETKIRELLGISADDDIEQALVALKSRPTQEQLDQLQAQITELQTKLEAPKEDADLEQARTEVATLTKRATAFEQETAKLSQQIQELQAEKMEREAGDRIDLAMRAGKVTKAELDAEDGFLRSMAKTDAKTFDKLMATRPARPELFTELGHDQEVPKVTIDDLFRLMSEKKAASPGITDATARAQVFAEHPELVALTRKES